MRLKSKYPLLFKIENKLCNKNFICGASHYKENNFYIDEKIFDEKIFMLKDIFKHINIFKICFKRS